MSISKENDTTTTSVKSYALYRTLMRALENVKAFKTGGRGIVALIAPSTQAAHDYAWPVRTYLYGGLGAEEAETVGYACISAKEKPDRARVEFEGRCSDKARAIVVAESRDLPPAIAVAVDTIVQLGPIEEDDLRRACQSVLQLKVSTNQARQLLAFPQELMLSAFRPNRTAAEVLKRLRSISPNAGLGRPIEEPIPRLEELHGYGEAKSWGLQLAADLKLWERGKLKWSEVDRGLLLSGPPGVGKTIFAKALAQTCGVYFKATSVVQWQSRGHLGDLLRAMRADFATAIDNAPSIIFLDELDSIGDRNTFTGEHATYSIQVVNGLLEVLDGAAGRDGLVIIGATNDPSKIDPAVRRPGRLDRHVEIGMPDADDRIAILRQHMGADISLDLGELGPRTDAMSGADLAQLVRDAKRLARRKGRQVILADLTSQLPQLISISGAYRRSVAIHEAGHTIVGTNLNHGKFRGVFISKQINPRFVLQNTGGAVFEVPVLTIRNEEHYRKEICVRLAGIAAEGLVLGSHDDGAGHGPHSDLAQATQLALEMETKAGMGKYLFQFGRGTSFDDFGPQQVPWLMDRVHQILREELARAQDILQRERSLLNAVAEALDRLGSVSPEQLGELREAVTGGERRPADSGVISNADKFRTGSSVAVPEKGRP